MLSGINYNTSYVLANYMKAFGVDVNDSLEKLTSGMRVVNPSDDPGSYFVASSLERRASATESVSRELSDNIEGLRSAQDTLNEIKAQVEEARDLAYKASTEDNATIRATYGEEYDTIMTNVSSLISQFTFNGDNLISSEQTITVAADEDTTSTISYTLYNTTLNQADGLNIGTELTAETDWTASKANATTYYNALQSDGDSGLTRLDRNISRVSNSLLLLEGRQTSLDNKAANYEAAASGLVGVDEAEEATTLAATQIMQQASAFFMAQANSNNQSVTQLMFGFNA